MLRSGSSLLLPLLTARTQADVSSFGWGHNAPSASVTPLQHRHHATPRTALSCQGAYVSLLSVHNSTSLATATAKEIEERLRNGSSDAIGKMMRRQLQLVLVLVRSLRAGGARLPVRCIIPAGTLARVPRDEADAARRRREAEDGARREAEGGARRAQMQQQLQLEHARLEAELASELDDVHRVESRMREITGMMSLFTSTLEEQQEEISLIDDSVADAAESTAQGHQQLLVAARRGRAFRRFFVFFVLLLAALLLFLHWMYP